MRDALQFICNLMQIPAVRINEKNCYYPSCIPVLF